MCFYGPAETTRTSRSLRGTASTKHPVPLSINQVAMLASLTRVASRPSCGLIRRATNATSVAIQKNVRHSSKLSQVLRAELEEERQVQYDEDVASMVKGLKDRGITIKDDPGFSRVRLFGPGVGDEKVTVEFDCDIEGEDVDDGWQDDLDDHSDDQEGAQNAQRLEDGEEHDEDNPDMDRPGYRFTATITKGVKKMELTGTASSKLAVQGIRINAANIERDSSLYRGPVFNELDPTLQEAMMDYLKARNIDDDLAVFICMYADQKEQTEYVKWLDDIEKFVK